MLRWESYRAVYGAELRAAAREYSDHGWPVVGACSAGLLLAPGATLPARLHERTDVALHTDGAAVLAPPSEIPDGWVHWRVAPALTGYRPSPAALIVAAVTTAVEMHESDRLPAVAGR